MSSQSTEDLIGATVVDTEEKQIENVPISDMDINNSEIVPTTSVSHEAGLCDADPDMIVDSSIDVPITSESCAIESVSTEKSPENDISSIKISDCDGDMDVCPPAEIVSNRPESEQNATNEVPMVIRGSESQSDVFHSPKKENLGEMSRCTPDTPQKDITEISSSTPTKATVTPGVFSSNSPGESILEQKISDDDDDIVVLADEQTFTGGHRGLVVPYSDTDDSDSSSSSDSESESSSDSSSSDNEEDGKKNSIKNTSNSDPKPVKVRGEIDIEDLPPIQDLHISVRNDQAEEIGKVLHAVDTLVVVECYKDQPPLDIDSVLFLDRGARPLGRIFDVMGPVTEPLYCVRFNSKEHIEEQNIQPGMLVYSAPQTEHSQFVFVKHLLMMKGSDASWKKDKEVPGSEQDFSDDELEAQIRRESTNRTENSPKNWDEPRRKVARPNQIPTVQGGQGGQGGPRGPTRGNFRPRNPWGWSGAQFNVPNNNQYPFHPKQNQFNGRGFVRPPAFNTESPPPNRMPHGNGDQYGNPSHTHYGPSPSAEYPPYENQGNSYAPESGYGNDYAAGNECDYSYGNEYSHGQEAYPPHNTPDMRYQAFQSEIAKLVQAYNSGVDSPMSVGAATYGMRPPGPQGPQFGGRPLGHRPRFGSRPPAPHPQFGPRATGPPRPPGPHPQYGPRATGPPHQFGSRPAGPPPQFAPRPPGPYDNHFY